MIGKRDFLAMSAAAMAAPSILRGEAPGVIWGHGGTTRGYALAHLRPAARLARVSSEAGAQAALVEARQTGPFSLLSGGHCFAGLSQSDRTAIESQGVKVICC